MEAPEPGTVERWAWDYLSSESLAHKLAPPAPPAQWEVDPPPREIAAPGRPVELVPATEQFRTPKRGALRDPAKRGALFHTFLHHELQATELMCWALLRYVDEPPAFRRGLLKIATDEIRHMQMYARYLEGCGLRFGDLPVRDWFWERVPGVADAAGFVATMGIGFEGGNLDHTERFAAALRRAGDEEGARLLDIVGVEEEPHVAFAIHWYERFVGPLDFDEWRGHLAPPLSPVLMRGKPVCGASRKRTGQPAAFIEALRDFRMT